MENNGTELTIGVIARQFGAQLEREYPLSPDQRKVLRAISQCRTHPLGNHEYECTECGEVVALYNSCRNRHCPQCQGISQRVWVEKQIKKLLPIPYFHLTTTIPDSFNTLIYYNESVIYNILFRSTWAAVQAQCKIKLKGTPGMTAVLHTWGQQLQRHPHIHCLITGGVLSEDETGWRSCSSKYFVDVKELSARFKASFCRRLKRAFKRGDLFLGEQVQQLADPGQFQAFMEEQEVKDWAVHCKKPFDGPEKVIEYIGRYTHRVGISNRRILDLTDGLVTFDYKDYRDCDEAGIPKHKTTTIPAVVFLRRFLQHVLPAGFRKIRHYGILGGDLAQDKIDHCRKILQVSAAKLEEMTTLTNWVAKCPCCGSPMQRLKPEPLAMPPPVIRMLQRIYTDAQ